MLPPDSLPITEADWNNTPKTVQALILTLWTFVEMQGVQPTNNAAERAVRSAVLWRKSSFGTHNEKGSQFVERMMTTVATLKQQQRNVLEYLVDACWAKIKGETPPSLLPAKISAAQTA